MSSRQANERKFEHWEDLADGGRRYWHDVLGHHGWIATYVKVVDASETTLEFWQEIYDETGHLFERHLKYPEDLGHEAMNDE